MDGANGSLNGSLGNLPSIKKKIKTYENGKLITVKPPLRPKSAVVKSKTASGEDS